MKQEIFYQLLNNIAGNDLMCKHTYLKRFGGRIFDASGWKMFKSTNTSKLNDGEVYRTIRCGYGGIYEMLNTWNAAINDWDCKVADGSYTIYYKDLEESDFTNV